MSKQLITIYRNDAANGNVKSLDVEEKLVKIRATLEGSNLMQPDDDFLLDGNPLMRSDESGITLSTLVKDTAKLYVGGASLGPISPERAIASWNNLSANQKRSLLSNIEIYRGLSLDENKGLYKSSNNVVNWNDNIIKTTNPRVITEVTSDYTFTKMTKEIKTFGVEKTSVSFTSPWASAESEYKHEKSKTTKSEKVSTYLLAKFIMRKVAIDVSPKDMTLNDEFVDAIKGAVRNEQDSVEGYVNLINVLNEYGYYIASTFTLGGVLYSSTETQVDKFSEAESEKQSFSVGFKAAFKGIGGGGSYENSSGSEQTSTEESKYKNQTFQQIGGINGTNNSYDKWVEGLDPAINWNVATYEKFVPTIALIGMANSGLGNVCCNLFSKYSTYASVKDRQKVINMDKYAQAARNYFVNPF